jgi:hypothetical protein
VLLAGVGLCVVVGLLGFGVDAAAVAGQPEEMAERLKWASGEKRDPRAEGHAGSPGELRRLRAEIGKAGAGPLTTARIGLVGVGVMAAGVGLWLRRGHWSAWLATAGAAWFGVFGLPLHWDSMQLLLGVAGAVAVAGSVLAALPPRWRYSILSIAALVHFTGILVATTWPETMGRTPWMTNQLGLRFYQPYFKFMYLGNAYHFYSPDPGAASKFFLLIDYEIADPDAPGGKRTTAEWVDIPKRRVNYRDPLGLTYYRRLSLTELASYSTPGTALPPSWEKADIMKRRQMNEFDTTRKQVSVPDASRFGEMDLSQYRQPHGPTRRGVHPSYARHVAVEYSGPRTEVQVGADGRRTERVLEYTVTGVKMFRVEHRIVDPNQFLEFSDAEELRRRERNPAADKSESIRRGGHSPYHPASYFPYYLGDFAPDGTLRNPNDPLLYWLTPVTPRANPPKGEPDFIDWMSKYAGHVFPWEGKE